MWKKNVMILTRQACGMGGELGQRWWDLKKRQPSWLLPCLEARVCCYILETSCSQIFFYLNFFYLLQLWYIGKFNFNSRHRIFKAQAKPKLKNSVISFSTHKIKKQNFTFSFSPVSFSSPRNSLAFWMCDWCSNCRKNKRISNGKIGKKMKA